MKTTFIFIVFSSLAFAQLTPDQNKIKSKILKSYYYSLNPNLNATFYAIKYDCLRKRYKIKLESEKEFLNKSDFIKYYPEWTPEVDGTIENSSMLQESLKAMHFNSSTKKNEIFPKCIKNPN